jgi:hypothetical protein
MYVQKASRWQSKHYGLKLDRETIKRAILRAGSEDIARVFRQHDYCYL